MSRAVEARKRMLKQIKDEIDQIKFLAHKRVDELLQEMLELTLKED